MQGKYIYTFANNFGSLDLSEAYQLTQGKEPCFGAKVKYQFILIFGLVLITLVNFGRVVIMVTQTLRSYTKKEHVIFCKVGCGGI